jgi:type IV secretory pathway VirB2 component (pilin)
MSGDVCEQLTVVACVVAHGLTCQSWNKFQFFRLTGVIIDILVVLGYAMKCGELKVQVAISNSLEYKWSIEF